MGIIIKKNKKTKQKNIKKQRSLKLLSKKLQNKNLKSKTKTKNSKLKAQNKNKKLLKTKTKTQNQKKQRRTHLSRISPKDCSRCPNFKKQEKHNCHFFETLKEVPIP